MVLDSEEFWRDIDGFDGRYQISNKGNVRSFLSRSKGGLLKPKVDKSGYMSIGLWNNSKKKETLSVHRLVALHFVPNTENKPTVNHVDGNKLNNTSCNLEWATYSEQTQHAFDNNLVERRGAPKYSKAFKQEIFEYAKANADVSIVKLSKLFNVSEKTISQIVRFGVSPRKTARVLATGETVVENIISQADVAKIKQMRTDGFTLSAISKIFNRSISQIHRITRGESRNTSIE